MRVDYLVVRLDNEQPQQDRGRGGEPPRVAETGGGHEQLVAACIERDARETLGRGKAGPAGRWMITDARTGRLIGEEDLRQAAALVDSDDVARWLVRTGWRPPPRSPPLPPASAAKEARLLMGAARSFVRGYRNPLMPVASL